MLIRCLDGVKLHESFTSEYEISDHCLISLIIKDLYIKNLTF